MATWTYQIERPSPGDIPGEAVCFGIEAARTAKAGASIKAQHCSRQSAVTFRIRAVDQSTGEVRETYACTNHACWLAHSARIGWLSPAPTVDPIGH